ncbi:hypothetical protein LR48_Vigan11g064600 [Vigna angularis]|uniref:Uncharacterized protein n=1 Tax=Phaseolus angularis TaxID=3914 RepID=A0A0L9VRP1_PHAAN|nr:hypothetical protein LR48_Vigan11g064600 [Vigna angularis]
MGQRCHCLAPLLRAIGRNCEKTGAQHPFECAQAVYGSKVGAQPRLGALSPSGSIPKLTFFVVLLAFMGDVLKMCREIGGEWRLGRQLKPREQWRQQLQILEEFLDQIGWDLWRCGSGLLVFMVSGDGG